MSVRPGSRRAGIAAGLAASALLGGLGVVAASPGQAANGFFLYKDGTSGLLTPVWAPEDEKCFDTFHGSEAKNFTTSNVILFADGLCSEVMLTLKPGETINLVFNSYGFTSGESAAPPARLPS